MVNADVPLGSYLARAMSEADLVTQRQRTFEEGDPRRQFINSYKGFPPDELFKVGSLIEYERGNIPSGFRLDEQAKELQLKALLELQEDQDVVQQALYFGILGDHVIIMPTRALHAGDLQEYLSWLLRERTHVLKAESALTFFDEPIPSDRPTWKRVKSITLRSPLTVDKLGERSTEQNPKSITRRKLTTSVWDLFSLEEAGGEFGVAEAQDLERLTVELQIKYAGRNRQLDTHLLDHVASLVPDDEAQFYTFHVEGVGEVKAGSIKLKKKKSIPYTDDQPDLDAVHAAMLDWLLELLDTGRVRQ
jgi:hypothetical protein